jgi:AraC family transcriptional regulator
MTDIHKRQQLREEYTARINRVIDHIETHLADDLSLETLSRVAHFSRFHFHRIFSAMVGETLNQYIQRLRVEKAASKLIDNHRASITEIALECGFSGSATFARAFRDAFQMSASEWRSGGHLRHRKNRKTKSNSGQQLGNQRKAFVVSSGYIDDTTHHFTWRIDMSADMQIEVEVKEMPEFHVAYIRHLGSYSEIGPTFGKLMKWAGPRGLLATPDVKTLGVYHDDPKVTEQAKLRSSACVTVPEGTPVEGEIGEMTVPGGQFAVAHFEITDDQFQEAWDAVMGSWFPESGYQPDDRPCYELCHNNYQEHPEKKHIVDICVPVRPM